MFEELLLLWQDLSFRQGNLSQLLEVTMKAGAICGGDHLQSPSRTCSCYLLERCLQNLVHLALEKSVAGTQCRHTVQSCY